MVTFQLRKMEFVKPGETYVPPGDPRIIYHGRWFFENSRNLAFSINPGNEIRFWWSGESVALHFDQLLKIPSDQFPTLWWKVEGDLWQEAKCFGDLRLNALPGKPFNLARAVLRSSDVNLRRWKFPVSSAFAFRGVTLSGDASLQQAKSQVDCRIEFLGDSHMEGIHIHPKGENSLSQSDARVAFAYRTAEMLNLEPRITGFNGQGLTVPGTGDVPPAIDTFPFIIDQVPKPNWLPDWVVVNYGTWDYMKKCSSEKFMEALMEYLTMIRQHYPETHLFVMVPFGQFYRDEIQRVVECTHISHAEKLHCIQTEDWIDPAKDFTDGMHLTETTHARIAQRLVTILRPYIFEKKERKQRR